MATSQAPLRKIVHEAGPELRLGDFEQATKERDFLNIRHQILGDRDDEAVRVREIGDQIAVIPEQPKNETQIKFDRNVVVRYEGLLERSEELRAELYSRMSAVGVGYADYARTIERPALVSAKEKLVPGRVSFAALAREYQALNVNLAEESQKYEASCRRLGLIAAGKIKEGVIVNENRERLAQVLKNLVEVREALYTKQAKLSLLDAMDLHMGVVQALAGFRKPKIQELVSVADRRQLLAIQFAYQGIEQRLDQVRVEQLRELDELALALRLAQESGKNDELPALEQALRDRLQGLATLFFVQREVVSFDLGKHQESLGSRYNYHLKRVWYHQIQKWLGEANDLTEAERESFEDLLVDLEPGVELARRQAYPYGLVLKNAPLEAYGIVREN